MIKCGKQLVLLTLFLIATACNAAKENTSQTEGSIAVLLSDNASSMRWEADDRRYFEGTFQAAGVEYTIFNACTQQTQAEQAITNGAKV